MATETLRELYHAELQDLYQAEHQIEKALSRLVSMATDSELKSAFERHLAQSRIHVERLELLFDEYELPKTGSGSTAIEALIQDSRTAGPIDEGLGCSRRGADRGGAARRALRDCRVRVCADLRAPARIQRCR